LVVSLDRGDDSKSLVVQDWVRCAVAPPASAAAAEVTVSSRDSNGVRG
jgi:hypothetical protein